MEKIVTLKFVSREYGLSIMGGGIKREWGFLAEYRHKIDEMFTAIVFDNKKIEGLEVLGYKVLFTGIRQVTFKIKENFDAIDNFLEEYFDNALQKVANKNFKAAVVAEKRNLNYGFGLRAKVIKYRVICTSRTEFLRAIQAYFFGVSSKKMQEILEKAEEIYDEKVKQSKRLKTLNHIRKTRESYKIAIAEIRAKAKKMFKNKQSAA